MAIRVKYMLVVCKEAPSSVPELVLGTSANNKEMLCKLHDDATPGTVTLKYLVQFDSLQTSSTWVQSWSDVLTCDSAQEAMIKIQQQIGTPPSLLSSFATAGVRSSAESKSADEKGEKDEKMEKEEVCDAEPGGEDHDICDQPDTISSVMSLERLQKYRDQRCILDCAPKNFFEESVEAKALGLKSFCAASMVQFQKKLEAAVWEFFQDHSRGDDQILVDFRAAKKDAVTVKLPAPTPTSMALPFVGPLSTTKTPKSIKFCTVFGVDFYINPCGEDLQTAEVLVPAWYCRPVTKADQAYFGVSTVTVEVVLSAWNSSLASVSVLPAQPPEVDGDVYKYFKLACSIQMLNPLADINQKLEADLKKNKEKAEKSTRNCINTSVKQAQKAATAKKKTNKRKRGAEEVGAEVENVNANVDGENASVDWAAKLKKAEEDQQKIDALVIEAVNACKKPSAIPITRLCSDSERVQNSSRAMLLQSVLREKQDAERKAAAEVVKTQAAAAFPGKLGAMAAVQAFERDGVLGGKGKKKNKAGGENSAAAAAENVMKLGKHVLK